MKKQKIRIQQQQHQEQQRRKEISAGLDHNSGPSSIKNRKAVDRSASGRRTPVIRAPSRFGRSDTDGDSLRSRHQSKNDIPVRPPRRKKIGYRSGGGTSGSEYSTSTGAIGVPGSILQRRRSIRSSIRSNLSNKSNKMRMGPGASGTKPANVRNYGDTDNMLTKRSQIAEKREGLAPEQRYRGSQLSGVGGLSRSDSRRSSRRAVVAASTAAARMQYHKQVSGFKLSILFLIICCIIRCYIYLFY